MKHLLYLAFVGLLFSSCGPVQRVDTAAMKEVINDNQIKRISPIQINSQVEMLGEKISKVLTPTIEKALAQNSKAEDICKLKNIELIDSLSKTYKVKIRLLGRGDVQNKLLYDKEREVLDAYLYNVDNKLSLSNNIQKIGDTAYVYTAPIANNKICEACFKDDASKLAVWSIVFNKAQVIRKMK